MLVGPLRNIAGRNASSWRQNALAYIAELKTQLDRLDNDSVISQGAKSVSQGAKRHLETAQEAAEKIRGPIVAWSGSAVERTWSNIYRAEVALLRLAPDNELAWWGTDVLARAQQHLVKEDLRRVKLEAHLRRTDGQLLPEDRILAVNTLQAANAVAQIERSSLRSFRNAVLGTAIALVIISIVLAIVGFVDPNLLRLCFNDPSTGPACPIGRMPSKWDLTIVELVGLAAAALVGALGLRHIQGTATPYTLPIVLGILKLPAGAISAVLGLLFIQGGFIPGLSNLDTSAQIIAWAAIFGAAQQAITGIVDTQGQSVLRNVRDASRGSVRDQATQAS